MNKSINQTSVSEEASVSCFLIFGFTCILTFACRDASNRNFNIGNEECSFSADLRRMNRAERDAIIAPEISHSFKQRHTVSLDTKNHYY